MFKYEIGQILKDKITGFEGVVMARSEYYTGCNQYGLARRNLDKDGRVGGWEWIDEIRLTLTGESIDVDHKARTENPGGPAPHAPEM